MWTGGGKGRESFVQVEERGELLTRAGSTGKPQGAQHTPAAALNTPRTSPAIPPQYPPPSPPNTSPPLPGAHLLDEDVCGLQDQALAVGHEPGVQVSVVSLGGGGRVTEEKCENTVV